MVATGKPVAAVFRDSRMHPTSKGGSNGVSVQPLEVPHRCRNIEGTYSRPVAFVPAWVEYLRGDLTRPADTVPASSNTHRRSHILDNADQAGGPENVGAPLRRGRVLAWFRLRRLDDLIGQPPSSRVLTGYYVTALLTIAALVIASHLVLDRMLLGNEGSAEIVNLSGRQRMLSQRIAGMAAQYRLGDPVARTELISAIDEFEAAHRLLIDAETDRAQVYSLYFSGPRPLDAQTRAFIVTARRIAALPPNDPAMPGLLAALFGAARSSLLASLNHVVSVHQHESEGRLALLRQIQWIILAIVLATLAVEAVAIFRPMVRRINIYTSELRRLATTDSLTGAANRRSFLERGAVEFERSRQCRRPLSVLMLDADHFKSINDTHGHAKGDEVLKVLSGGLRAGLRASDLVGRIGGEEFAVLLPEIDLTEAIGIAERLRHSLAGLAVPDGEGFVKFTVSIGVAPVLAGSTGVEAALSAADTALYRAKQGGRNRVAVAECH